MHLGHGESLGQSASFWGMPAGAAGARVTQKRRGKSRECCAPRLARAPRSGPPCIHGTGAASAALFSAYFDIQRLGFSLFLASKHLLSTSLRARGVFTRSIKCSS